MIATSNGRELAGGGFELDIIFMPEYRVRHSPVVVAEEALPQAMVSTTSTVFDTSVAVLVLKVGSYPLHRGRLGIARSMGRVGVPVFGVYEDRFTPGAVSKYVRGRVVWKNEDVSAEAFLEGLDDIARHLKRQTVLVPTDDHGAILIAERGRSLDERFVFPVQPTSLPRTLASKEGLYRTCREFGVPCPEAFFPTTRADVEEFVSWAAFPVVVKAIRAWDLRGHSTRSTAIVDSPESLLGMVASEIGNPSPGVMLQEYIPREQGEDWFYHGYCNEDSECLVSFTGIKLRSYPAHAGPTTFGRSVENVALRTQAEELFRALNYRGIMGLDYRFDLRDGQYKLLDFNPRIGAQFRLFETEAGVDVMRALRLEMTGHKVPQRVP